MATKKNMHKGKQKIKKHPEHLKVAKDGVNKAEKTESKKKNAMKNKDIAGVLILTTGILLFVGLYIQEKVGPFGDLVAMLLGGLFGWPSVLLPIIIIMYGIGMLFSKKKNIKGSGLLLFVLFVILISAMTQTAYYASHVDEFINMSFGNKINRFFSNGTRLAGGGAVGALLAMPLISIFQILGTIVILTAFLLITVIYITNMSVSEFLQIIFGLVKRGFTKPIQAIKCKMENSIHVDEKPEPKLEGFNIKENDKKQDHKKRIFDINILDSLKNPAYDEPEDEQDPEPGIQFAEPDEPEQEPVKEEKRIPKERKEPANIDIKLTPKEQKDLNKQLSENAEEKFYQYEYPKASLLMDPPPIKKDKDEKDVTIQQATKLIDTLNSFGVEATVSMITKGPAVIRYELKPETGVRAKRFVDLADDIALNLAARSIRVEAPIPGKDAIGIEIPKNKVTPVYFKELITSPEFIRHPGKMVMALGKDIIGNTIVADISKMPHLLVAGATGSGKSVCINSLIMSILFKASPDEVRLLMIDPKMVELSRYNGIPHLLIPVVTDPKKAAGALHWVVQEMLDRYNLFYSNKVVDIESYNELVTKEGTAEKMPQILIIIDELADLMTVAKNEVEDSIQRLAQMARAAGMHLVIATQRPSVNVITGVIKANIPSRISFAVSSPQDSRTILDKGGAEKLLGKGDMLFHPLGENVPIRIQGTYVSSEEVAKTVEFVKSKAPASYNEDIMEKIDKDTISISPDSDAKEADELLNEAIELVVAQGQASTSYVQRKLSIGYARAGRIIDQMEERGIIGGYEGSKPRQVLISKDEWYEMKMRDEMLSVNDMQSGIFGNNKYKDIR